MRRPSICFVSATTTALLLGSTCSTPSSVASSELTSMFDSVKETCGDTKRYATIVGNNTVPVATTATSALMDNAVYSNVVFCDLQGRAIGSLGGFTLLPDLQTWSMGHTTTTLDGRTATTTTTSITTTITTLSDTSAAQTSSTIITYHDSFSGGDHEDTDNEFGWRQFQHEPLRLPDQFMARFFNTLMYLAEVITADVISALLFGRWRPRYYQRARKNRINWKRRMRFRRFKMNVTDVVVRIWGASVQLHHTLRVGQDDVSGPTYQMISNLQLTEYPATLSTFSDVPTSEVIATMTSAGCSALVSIACMSAPTLVSPALWLVESSGPPVSPRQLLLPEVPVMSAVASCCSRASLPNTGLEMALRPAASPRVPLLLPAASPTTGPSMSKSQSSPEATNEEMTLYVERPLTAMCPSAISTTKGRAVNNTSRPSFRTMNMEREWLAVLGVNLLLEGLSSPCPTTSPATRKHRRNLVAAETAYGNAEGMVNTLVRYNTAEPSVTTPVEEFGGGQADTADKAPPSPFFVSENYTPESTCFVSAHGVAYTTIIMSYTHQFNHPTRGDTPEDTPTTTQAGDVSDILWPAMDARMRCTWSQACIQTTSSEYYRSSVEAVFESCFIPDESEMEMLNDLVRKHL